jgi:hypothetical protein
MKTYLVSTRAEFEQTYKIEAENEEKAKEIALENTEDFYEQTQISTGEVLAIQEIENEKTN